MNFTPADALYATPACTRTVITRFTMTHAGKLLIEVPSVPVLKIDLVVQYEMKKITGLWKPVCFLSETPISDVGILFLLGTLKDSSC